MIKSKVEVDKLLEILVDIQLLLVQRQLLLDYAEAEEREWASIQPNDDRYGWDTLKEKRQAALRLGQ